MRVGTSFGDACRYCGSTEIILEPASSSGHCAQCSHEAAAWAVRASDTIDRYAMAARLESDALTANARRIEQSGRVAERRDAVARTAVRARVAVATWLHLPPLRARASSQA